MGIAPKKRTRIQAENESRIVASALDIFAQYGYRGATVDKIADATGGVSSYGQGAPDPHYTG